jgi:hypothetical protein
MNEMERRVLEEERTSPRYTRYMFLRGFRLSLGGIVPPGGKIASYVKRDEDKRVYP